MKCDYCGSTEDVRHVELSAENICEPCDDRLTAELIEALKKWALCKDAYDAEPQFLGLYAELVSAENGLLAALAAVGEETS